MVKAQIKVTLKQSVLDPQGQAIEGALGALGFQGVGSVRQGKYFEIELDGSDPDAARAQLEQMCEKLLANTVIEDYSINVGS